MLLSRWITVYLRQNHFTSIPSVVFNLIFFTVFLKLFFTTFFCLLLRYRVRYLIASLILQKLKYVQENCQFPLKGSVNLVGAYDPTSTLQEGEVFVCINNGTKGGLVEVGTVLVMRNPCMHPGKEKKRFLLHRCDTHNLILHDIQRAVQCNSHVPVSK
jgi:RNA dependent RNA polymerase